MPPKPFTSESAKAAAAKRWAKPQPAPGDAPGHAAPTTAEDEALAALRSVVTSKTSPPQAVVAAAKAVLDQREARPVALPHTLEDVRSLSTSALHTLLLTLEDVVPPDSATPTALAQAKALSGGDARG